MKTERRARTDRRVKPTPAIGPFWFRGRRGGARRQTDFPRGYYVDHPGSRALAAVTILLIFEILDGVFTLRLMEQGAHEVNPFMASLLSMGTAVFACVKYGIAVAALVILLIHKNYVIFHPLLRVKWLLVFLLFTHATLIGYEVMLLAGYSR